MSTQNVFINKNRISLLQRSLILCFLTLGIVGGLLSLHALERPVQTGWNLMAFPISQDSYVAKFVNTNQLHSKGLSRIWAWEQDGQGHYTWHTYPQVGSFPELEVVRPNQGYWIHATKPFVLESSQFSSGNSLFPPYPVEDQDIQDLLSGEGFNLIGFSFLKNNQPTIALTEQFANIDNIMVWGWSDNEWRIWHPSQSNEALNTLLGGTDFKALTDLKEGRGYWVNSAEMEVDPDNGSDPGSGTGSGNQGESCVTDLEFYEDTIWTPVLATNCVGCHVSGGAAGGTRFVLKENTDPNYLTDNFDTTKTVALIEAGGQSLWIAKPTNTISHGGGPRFEVGGSKYQDFTAMVERFQNPTECTDPSDPSDPPSSLPPSLFSQVIQANDQQTLRKASLSLTGKLPSTALNSAVGSGTTSLDQALDTLMTDEAFYSRLKEIWNDLFLTEKYSSGSSAINLLSSSDYPDRKWYDVYYESDRDKYYYLRNLSNQAVSRAGLELIVDIVKNNRPFTEIVTADYMMLNPMSAKSYSVTDLAFEDSEGTDYTMVDLSFQQGKLEGIPHAGILTDPMFLNRFPTTATNRNRHRARIIFDFFLDTDILRLSTRPVDSNAVGGHNPTLFNPQCNICHALMDPVAGTFQNWDSRGRYREEVWYQDMRQPGFSEENVIPFSEYNRSLQWFGEQVAADARFPKSIVKKMYTGLTGKPPLILPDDLEATDYQAQKDAYDTQNAFFEETAQSFKNDNFNLKTVVKTIIQSPYYRATGLRSSQTERTPLYQSLDSARLLTPEMLDRKIESVLGYPWIYYNDFRNLLHTNRYRTLYGGHDSNTITSRLSDPNGVMSAVQKRMSNEMSCTAVARDFSIQNREDRLLFPYVENGYEPEDDYGFPIPGATQAIRENIRHLHGHILGEGLALDDPEIDRTYSLFYQTWKLGKAKVQTDEVDDYLYYSCRAENVFGSNEKLPEEQWVRRDAKYTIRAWKAVVTYLLRDYRFLYE